MCLVQLMSQQKRDLRHGNNNTGTGYKMTLNDALVEAALIDLITVSVTLVNKKIMGDMTD